MKVVFDTIADANERQTDGMSSAAQSDQQHELRAKVPDKLASFPRNFAAIERDVITKIDAECLKMATKIDAAVQKLADSVNTQTWMLGITMALEVGIVLKLLMD